MKTGIALIVLLIIGVLFKPSLKNFKEFVGERDDKGYQIEARKVNDYLLFAVYEKTAFYKRGERHFELRSRERFNGYLLNFYSIDSNSDNKHNSVLDKAKETIDSTASQGIMTTDSVKL